jgi:hypothetical protein
MLKTVSSITNAIGALNYKGTWNASTNSPALASGVGTKGDYYVVSVAGSTALDGISNWGIGDWAVFNGSVWQRVEGGADLNGVNLSVSGTSTLSGLTASTALALDASKNVVSVTNTGTGNNVLQTDPTLVDNVTLSTGNIIQGTAGKGLLLNANTPAAGMTSQLLNWYEEGTWTPAFAPASGAFTTLAYLNVGGTYTRTGRKVTINGAIATSGAITLGTAAGQLSITGLPFSSAVSAVGAIWTDPNTGLYNSPLAAPNKVLVSGTTLLMYKTAATNDATYVVTTDLRIVGGNSNRFVFSATYTV